MKNYNFKIKVDKQDEKKLIKKSFSLKLKNEIDFEEMFEEAICFLDYSSEEFFKLRYMDEYMDFEIIRGKQKAKCWLEHEYCSYCGGGISIGGAYEEK